MFVSRIYITTNLATTAGGMRFGERIPWPAAENYIFEARGIQVTRPPARVNRSRDSIERAGHQSRQGPNEPSILFCVNFAYNPVYEVAFASENVCANTANQIFADRTKISTPSRYKVDELKSSIIRYICSQLYLELSIYCQYGYIK